MFPGMHRRLQQLDGARTYEILAQASHAVLSVTDSVGLRLFGADQPHSRRQPSLHTLDPYGAQIATLRSNPKISVCVAEQEEIQLERLTSYFRRHGLVCDRSRAKRKALKRLVDKYSLGFEAQGKEEAEEKLNHISLST